MSFPSNFDGSFIDKFFFIRIANIYWILINIICYKKSQKCHKFFASWFIVKFISYMLNTIWYTKRINIKYIMLCKLVHSLGFLLKNWIYTSRFRIAWGVAWRHGQASRLTSYDEALTLFKAWLKATINMKIFMNLYIIYIIFDVYRVYRKCYI